MIPYARQTIDDTDIDAVVEVLRSPLLTQGPVVERFEVALGEHIGAPHIIACASGTAALHLAYAGLGLGAGDEIITTPVTFAATANAALALGATPVFADVQPATGNIDPRSISERITPRTRGIVAVHLGGLPADMAALRAIADHHRLWLVEDAAHALGARYAGAPVGSQLSDAATFSFHPVKHITTAEGGAVATRDAELARRIRALRIHGVERDPARWQARPHGRWYYEVQHAGYNYRLSDLQCALGLAQLRRLPAWLERRREIAAGYRDRLRARFGDAVATQPELADRSSAYHLMITLIDYGAFGIGRARVADALAEQGVGSQVHYIPLCDQPLYRHADALATRLGVRRYYQRTLSLPMYPALTDADLDTVVGALERALLSRACILEEIAR